jgi:cyclopropane fatty-acyl-phospholipid synthase-like methyltransferase
MKSAKKTTNQTYLLENQKFWAKGYNAPNPESVIFRFAGRILKSKFNLPSLNERLLDFGCGQGANTNYFHNLGFNVSGIDISDNDINVARIRYPNIGNNFHLCDPSPSKNEFYGWKNEISVIVCSQSLYYFSEKHFNEVLIKLYNSMKKGGIIFASMISEKHTYFNNSSSSNDSWIRKVSYKGRRFNLENYFCFFTKNKKECEMKFKIFKKVFVGEYSLQLEDGESNNHHWVFIGQK